MIVVLLIVTLMSGCTNDGVKTDLKLENNATGYNVSNDTNMTQKESDDVEFNMSADEYEEGLTEFEVEPGEKEYLLIYFEADIRSLNDEEQELFDKYAPQYTENYMKQWVTITYANVEYINEISYAIGRGSMYTYINGTWYVGDRVFV
jgi:hypothetical protein